LIFPNPFSTIAGTVKMVAIAAAVIAIVSFGKDLIGSLKQAGKFEMADKGRKQRVKRAKESNTFKDTALKKAKPNASMGDFDNLGR